MEDRKIKKPIKAKSVRIIWCVALYLILLFFILGLFLFNAAYQKIYRCPEVKNGKADFENVEIPSRDVACNLAGEWEFFYNKWIVTDGEDCTSDGIVKLPSLWTYKDFGGGVLPKTGYASYRMYAENVQPNIDLHVFRYHSNHAFRIFVNGKLIFRSGELSKDEKQTKITGKTDEEYFYKTDGNPLEIVIELSATDAGGFNSVPWLASYETGISYGRSLRTFNYIAIGFTSAIVIASVLMFVFFKTNRDIFIPLFLVMLDVNFLASKDMSYVLDFIPSDVSLLISYLSAIVAFVFLALHFHKSDVRIDKKFALITAIIGGVSMILTIFFYGTPISSVFAFIIFADGTFFP